MTTTVAVTDADLAVVRVPGCPTRLGPGTPRWRSRERLVGTDGNAFALIGRVTRGLHRAGAPAAYTDAVVDLMQEADYDHLLAVAAHFSVRP